MEDFKIQTEEELVVYDRLFYVALKARLQNLGGITSDQLIEGAHVLAILSIQKRREICP